MEGTLLSTCSGESAVGKKLVALTTRRVIILAHGSVTSLSSLQIELKSRVGLSGLRCW